MERTLCCYLSETDETGVPDPIIQLISKNIQDKMFALRSDSICVARDDKLHDIKFGDLDWNILRYAETALRQPREAEIDYTPDSMSTIFIMCESMAVQAEEDSYGSQEIIFFGNFITELKEKEVQDLAKKLSEGQFETTIVVPDAVNRSAIQEKNIEFLYNGLSQLKGPSNLPAVITLKEINVRLSNMATKKSVRPFPWNVDLKIGPDLTIEVSFFLCTRKNSSSALVKQGLMKDMGKFGGAILPQSQNNKQLVPVSNTIHEDDDEPGYSSSNAGQIAELKSKVAQKEEIWSQRDGGVIDKEDIVDGYYYGDKLVSFDEIQTHNQYTTGEKCLDVLFFTTRDAIKACQFVGDGNDVVFPRKAKADSEIRFSALLQAMHNLNRIAIVRKIRTTNAKLVLGILSPDISRKCLVFTELCFADDVSIPYFAPLLKGDSELTGAELTPQENLIDELILCKSVANFTPFNGPVDPSVLSFRETVFRKYIGSAPDKGKRTLVSSDCVQLHFEEIVGSLDEDLKTRMLEAFPLKEVVEKGADRPSGQQIFRKRTRELEAIKSEASDDKKFKPDEDIPEPVPVKDELEAASEFDPDNLLDDM